jgi:hypothetical protein
VRGGKVGFSLAKTALSVGAAAAAGTAVQEVGLQATQETRTVQESAIAVGGSAILGGLIGMAGAKFLSHGEWSRLGQNLERELAGETENPAALADTIVQRMKATGGGADVLDEASLADLGVGGPAAAQAVARATAALRINPGVETMFSPSRVVRETYDQLVDNPVYTKMNMEGRTLGAGVENLVKETQRGLMAQWLRQSNKAYQEARKSGWKGTRTEFNELIGQAGRRGDVDPSGNATITSMAQDARSRIFDPLLERAKKHGLLPEDVGTSTSASYVSRLWNRQRLIAREPEFRQIATKWVDGLARKSVEAMKASKETKVAKLKAAVSDLELPSADRANLLESLPAQLDQLKADNPSFVAADQALSPLRSALRAARETGDKTAASSLTKQIEQITTSAGQSYADFVTSRNLLQSRIARVRNNVVGSADRVDALKAKIGDVEAANIERLRRLHRSLTILDENTGKVAPEVVAKQLSDARTQFAQVIDRSNKAQDRLAQARVNHEGDAGKLDAVETAFEKAEETRLAEAARAADRVGDLEKIDPEEALAELRALVEKRISTAADLVQRETKRMVDLARRIGDADPKKVELRAKSLKERMTKIERDYNDIVDVKMDAQNDYEGYVTEVVDSVFNNLTGRGAGSVPDHIVPVTRGPLKERTFNIPDNMVEDFLENDMELVLRHYTRKMGSEIELTEKFGRADMRDQIEGINREYDDLSKAAKTEPERIKLDKARKRDLKNIEAFRDMVRGTYRAADEDSNWSRLTRAALTWNYIRLLGGVTVSSLTDASRLIGVHGVRATMTEALPALVSGLKAAKISRQDARDLGVVAETVLQSRLSTLADLQDPYRQGSAYERFLSNSSNVFSKATGLSYWNDMMTTMAAVMTQNRMMRNALDWTKAGKREQAYMAYLGVDETMAQRIASQFEKHGTQEKGIYGANVSAWDDESAARAWGAALAKDTGRTIIQKGVSDTPLWMKSNWGRLIMQFKSFGLASHQRVLIAGLQERPHRLAEQMVFGTAVGMMIGLAKYYERGDFDEANRLMHNPGLWVADGLDRTGILSLPFEVSNTAQKVGSPFGIVPLSQALANDPDRGGAASRYAGRNKLGAVMGPSAGIFEDLTEIATQLTSGNLKKSGVNAIVRQIPGGSLPIIRSVMHGAIKPALQDAVE